MVGAGHALSVGGGWYGQPVEQAVATAAQLGQWSPVGPYLNTASFGLPPQSAFDELQQALGDWRGGRTSWEHWGESTDRARATFARLHNVAADSIAIGATVSELIGLVAASAPDGSRVLAFERDFTSLLYPWAAHAARGVTVTTAPLDELAERIEPGVDFVVVSVAQSASGELAPLDEIAEAAHAVGALVVVDSTQASGWLSLDAGRVDALACAGYKWLLSPRGTAYLYLGEALRDRVPSLHAGWYAADDVHASYYGLPPHLAGTVRRLDTSPAWFSWVGAAPALEVLEEIGIERVHPHNVALANRFRAGLGLEPSDSAIVSAHVPDAHEKLERAGIRAATRGGSLRVSFHVYNTTADVDAALDALV
jgi:selenocysteine lyase/cysteine desulfurase